MSTSSRPLRLNTASVPRSSRIPIAVFSAAAGGQAPVIAEGEAPSPRRSSNLIKDKGADANHNGVLSNEEILAFTREKSKTACADASACPLGLTPTLEPATAVAGSPLPGAEAERRQAHRRSDSRLFSARGNTSGVALEMMPASPIKSARATSASASPARRRATSSFSTSATTVR